MDLFRTVHGSRLYGLAHAESDNDWYTVVSKVKRAKARYSTHKVVDSEDSVVVDFGTWLDQCRKGVPQALEAMFSQMPVYDNIAALRAGWRCGTEVYDTYFRTIKSFAFQEEYKKRRHALRLALNLNEMGRTGRFNPTLSEADARYISAMATKTHEDVYGLALCLAWE
jgi:hypothetical protein